MDYKPSCIKQEFYPGTKEEQEAALKNSEQLAAYREYRLLHRDDPWNPGFHFYAPDGKINDPNGLCFWNGLYHLFYQAYPPAENPAPDSKRLHWGHAVSKDMVHWKDLPLAIYPDHEIACFSGSSLVEEDRVLAIYHGRWKGTMIAEASDPLLLNWEKIDKEPVIPILPDQKQNRGRPYSMFDPFLWKDETGYYSLSGTHYGDPDKRGSDPRNQMVEQLFHSQDLKHWTYMGELAPGGFPQIPEGNDGACPYFWPLGDRYVLLNFSHLDGAKITIGDFDPITHRFTPDRTMNLNHGPRCCSSYQAPCATPDGKGGLYFLLNTKDAVSGIPRNGAMSFMYHMTLNGRDDIRISPVEEVENLHSSLYEAENLALPAFQEEELPISGNMLDISMRIDLQKARALSLKILKSSDEREFTEVRLYAPAGPGGNKKKLPAVTVDTMNSSLSEMVRGRVPETAMFGENEDGKIDLRILVDKCMVEVFANERNVVMQMAYPTLPDSTGISLKALGSDIVIENLKVWKMRGIYDDIESDGE